VCNVQQLTRCTPHDAVPGASVQLIDHERLDFRRAPTCQHVCMWCVIKPSGQHQLEHGVDGITLGYLPDLGRSCSMGGPGHGVLGGLRSREDVVLTSTLDSLGRSIVCSSRSLAWREKGKGIPLQGLAGIRTYHIWCLADPEGSSTFQLPSAGRRNSTTCIRRCPDVPSHVQGLTSYCMTNRPSDSGH